MMNIRQHLLIFGVFSTVDSLPFLDSLVITPSGPVQGTTTYVTSRPVQTFLGIPFAKPPVGELRFRRPETLEPWTETLVARDQPPACVQFTTFPFPWYDFEPGKSEDCLYMNIWAPMDSQNGSKKAVMFWIYGGGPFGSNRKTVYDGRVLAGLGDVVFVSPNFRLGLFGFLTSGTKELAGNIGIWDLLHALRWVRNNIESFGGDPNQITLQGESSGSLIVSLLCVSPLTKGLFSKAIMQSGSAIVLQENPRFANLKMSQRLAEAVGCASNKKTIQNDTRVVVNCLRGRDSMHLAKTVYSFDPTSDATFPPEYGDELFPNPPYEDIRKGRFHSVPLLIGNNENEGVCLVRNDPSLFGFFGQREPGINKTYAKTLLALNHCSADIVARHYLGNIQDDDHFSIRQNTYKAVGEMTCTCPTSYFAESYADQDVDVYYYLFIHRPSSTPWAPWMGSVHFDEVQFVFGLPIMYPLYYTLEEVRLSMQMVKMWTQFAKHGSPSLNFDWPKYSKKNPAMVIVDTNINDTSFKTRPSPDSCNLLRSCYKP